MPRRISTMLGFGAIALSLGCPQHKAGDGEGTGGSDPLLKKPVASIGNSQITVGQLKAELDRQNPYIRLRFSSLERKREFLTNMVRFEVLAQEAQRRNLQNDPEVIRRAKRVMVERLIEQLHKDLVSLDDIKEADVRAHYDKHKEQFVQPQQVRVSQIVVATEKDAQKVLDLARQKPGDIRHFGELVTTHSIDAASKARRGDLDFFTAENKTLPPEVVKAAFAIPGMWKLAGPIKSGDKFVVLLKSGDRPAVNRPLEVERGRIKNQLFNQRRHEAVQGYIKKLHDQAQIKIDEANLGKVKVDVKVGPLDPHGNPLRGHGH